MKDGNMRMSWLTYRWYAVNFIAIGNESSHRENDERSSQ